MFLYRNTSLSSPAWWKLLNKWQNKLGLFEPHCRYIWLFCPESSTYVIIIRLNPNMFFESTLCIYYCSPAICTLIDTTFRKNYITFEIYNLHNFLFSPDSWTNVSNILPKRSILVRVPLSGNFLCSPDSCTRFCNTL